MFLNLAPEQSCVKLTACVVLFVMLFIAHSCKFSSLNTSPLQKKTVHSTLFKFIRGAGF